MKELSVGAFVAVAVIIFVGRRLLAPLSIDAVWVRLIGAATLVGSTVFAVAARLALGRSWSLGPRAAVEDGLRTEGPYAVARFMQIYTGDSDAARQRGARRAGQWLVLPAAAWVVIEVEVEVQRSGLLLGDVPGRLSRVPRARAAADSGLAPGRLAP